MNQISNDKLCSMYKNMFEKLGKEYPFKFYMWISIFHKDIDEKLLEADIKINAVWERCIEGKASLMEFIGALNLYKGYMLKGYKIYETRNKR